MFLLTDGQPSSIKMKLLPDFSFNYNLGMLQLIRLLSKESVDEKTQQKGGVVSVDKVRGGSSLPLSLLFSRTLVRADPSLAFWRPWRAMTMDRSLAVGNGAVIGAGTVLEISF